MQNQNSKLKTELKHRAYQYSIKVIEFLDTLPRDISSGVIAKQPLKSATSIGANVVGAKAASSYWLGLLRDAKKINNAQLRYLLDETRKPANILGLSVLTLKEKK